MTTTDDELSRYNIEIKRELEGRTELAKRVIKERDQLRTKLTEAEALIERLVVVMSTVNDNAEIAGVNADTLVARLGLTAVAEWRKGKG